jgi:hypothetical protein
MPVKPAPFVDDEFGPFPVIVLVVVLGVAEKGFKRLLRFADLEGTGDNVTVVVPMVMLSCGVKFDNQVGSPLLSPIK